MSRRCARAAACSTSSASSRQRLNRSLSPADQQRMDQYFTSVRELEQRLHSVGRVGAQAEARGRRAGPGRHRRSPRVRAARPQLMFDVIKLALETDSSRLDLAVHRHDGDPQHHAPRQPARSARRTARPRKKASSTPSTASSRLARDAKEEGQSLLDRTMVLYGTCMGSANSHSQRQPAGAARRRRLQARPAPRLRHAEQLPADEPLRLDAAAPGHRDERVLDRQGNHDRAGDGVRMLRSMIRWSSRCGRCMPSSRPCHATLRMSADAAHVATTFFRKRTAHRLSRCRSQEGRSRSHRAARSSFANAGELRALGQDPRPHRAGRDAAEEAPAARPAEKCRRSLKWLQRVARQGGAVRGSTAKGRTGVRRLTRAEYENTVRDLFDMPGIALQGQLAGRRLGARLRQEQRRARHLARQPGQVRRGRRPRARPGHRHAAQRRRPCRSSASRWRTRAASSRTCS